MSWCPNAKSVVLLRRLLIALTVFRNFWLTLFILNIFKYIYIWVCASENHFDLFLQHFNKIFSNAFLALLRWQNLLETTNIHKRVSFFLFTVCLFFLMSKYIIFLEIYATLLFCTCGHDKSYNSSPEILFFFFSMFSPYFLYLKVGKHGNTSFCKCLSPSILLNHDSYLLVYRLLLSLFSINHVVSHSRHASGLPLFNLFRTFVCIPHTTSNPSTRKNNFSSLFLSLSFALFRSRSLLHTNTTTLAYPSRVVKNFTFSSSASYFYIAYLRLRLRLTCSHRPLSHGNPLDFFFPFFIVLRCAPIERTHRSRHVDCKRGCGSGRMAV